VSLAETSGRNADPDKGGEPAGRVGYWRPFSEWSDEVGSTFSAPSRVPRWRWLPAASSQGLS
jgi:hypothetical protein